jgi:hypothetical protein
VKKIAIVTGIVLLLPSLSGCACANGRSANASEKNVIPGAPSAMRLSISLNGFKLTWELSPQDPGIVTGYEIARADLASGPFNKVATVNKGVSEYIDTTASPEIIYYYKVRAVAGALYSLYSNMVTGER